MLCLGGQFLTVITHRETVAVVDGCSMYGCMSWSVPASSRPAGTTYM